MITALSNFINIFGTTICDVEMSSQEVDKFEEYLKAKESELSQISSQNKNDQSAIELIKNSNLQFRYRTYIRTLYSHIEGCIYGIIEILLKQKEYFAAEENQLPDKTNGRTYSSGEKNHCCDNHTFEERIKISLRLFSKLSSNSVYLDFCTKSSLCTLVNK